MTLSSYNGGFSFNSQVFNNWIPPYLENIDICPKYHSIEHLPSFASDEIFCNDQSSSKEQTSSKEQMVQRTGTLNRLWKAFQITLGIGSLDGGTAKEQWHAKAERSAPEEEPKIESSLKDIRRRLVKLEQKKISMKFKNDATSSKTTSISDSLNLMWARQWAFTHFCEFENPSTERWCHEGMNALKKDIALVDTFMQEGKSDLFLSLLEKSTLAPFKSFFDKKNFVVSPELLLASNAQLMSESFELKRLSELELLSMMLSLFEGTVETPSISSLKNALQVAFELQQQVIDPFKASLTTTSYLKKHLVGDTLDVRLKKATDSFKEILEEGLNRISNQNSDRKSILIPGGLAGTRAIAAKVTPYMIKIVSKALKNYDLTSTLDTKDLLQKIDGWVFSASKTSYYEIEAQSNGKFTFRIYENNPKPNPSSEEEGYASPQTINVRSDIDKETLLSHPVLRTLVETQLIGDLINELPAYSFDKKGALEAGASIVDTLLGMIGLKQVNWEDGLIVNELLPLLGGKPVIESNFFSSEVDSISSSSSEWDSLVMVLKHYGSSHEESERIVFATRLALLQRFCNEHTSEAIGNDDKYLTILTASKETLARRTLSIASQGIFNENDLNAIRLVISQAEHLLSRAKEVEELRLQKEAPFVSFTSQLHHSPFPLIKLPYRIPQNEGNLRLPSPPLYRPIDELVNWQPTEQKWFQDIKMFSDIFLKEIDEKNLAAVIDGVELLVEKLDPFSSWKVDITPEAAELAIVSLSEIARAYFVAHFNEQGKRYSDPKGFFTIIALLDIAEDLKMFLPKSHGLSEASAIGPYFNEYLSMQSNENLRLFKSEDLLLTGFRLFDPVADLRFQRMTEKHLKTDTSSNLLSLGIEDDYFGAMGEMGLGLWRFRNDFSYAWPLGFESSRIDYQSSSGNEILKNNPIIEPLFDKKLPYWSSFEEKFPDLARNGTQLEQVAAAYGDVSETTLPKSFYRLRELGTIARYFLKSPFISAEGPVTNRESYRNEFHAVHNPKIEFAIPEYFKKPTKAIKIANEGIRLFSEIRGIDSNLLSQYPDIFSCIAGVDNCHNFNHAYDPYQNEVLKKMDRTKLLNKQGFYGNLQLYKWMNVYSKSSFIYLNHHLTGRNNFNINEAMTSYLKTSFPGGLDWKDSVRLQSILSHRSTQISSLLSFFSTHLSLFEGEEKKQWQSFLKINLFEPGVLIDTLTTPASGEDTLKALDHFCDKGYRYFHSRNKLEEAAYFLDVSLLLTRYIAKVTPNSTIDVSQFKMLNMNKIIDTLRMETAVNGTLSERSKGPLAGALAKHLLEEYKVYSDEELEKILELTMLYYRYPTTNQGENRQQRDAIVKGMHRIAPQIKRLVSDDHKRTVLFQKLINRIVPAALNTKIVTIDSEGLRYASESRNLEIDLLEGRISMHGMGDQTLPFAILKDRAYQHVFGNREYIVSLINPSTWEFIDDNGYLCRITKENSGYQILRKIDGKHWYRFVFADHFVNTPKSDINRKFAKLQEIDDRTSSLGSLHFIKGYTHWYHDEAPAELFLLDESTQNIRYKASLSHTAILSSLGGKDMVNAIYDLSQKKPLKLLNIYNEASSYQWLENIEDLRHVLIWADSDTGIPKRIELPRYKRFYESTDIATEMNKGLDEKLSFTIDDNRAYCDQIPGYYLEPKQFNNHFFRLKALLVLRNNSGDQKIILPSWLPKSQSALSLKPSFDDVRSLGITHHDYIVLEKSKDQSVFCGVDVHANIYHSLILQTQHRYSESVEVLSRYGHTPKAYTKSERELLHTIVAFALNKSLDEQPAAIIPAMEALVLLIKDHRAHASNINIKASEIKRLYQTYYKNTSQLREEGIVQEKGAIIARYLLEIENALGDDLLEQYRQAAENDPIAAHHALADYAYKKLFLSENFINKGLNQFSSSSFFSKDNSDISPYERIDAVELQELARLVTQVIKRGNSILSTGLMLKPTELEFANEFMMLVKKIPFANEQERKEIAIRCHLIQSDSKVTQALSQIVIELALKPDLLKGFEELINFEADSMANTLKVLRNKALNVASKNTSLKKATNDPKFDIGTLFKKGSNLIKEFIDLTPRFDPGKFPSTKQSTNQRTGVNQKIPQKVVFGPLLDNYEEHIVLNVNERDSTNSDNTVKGYKKILEPFLLNNQTQRYRDESQQLISSVEAYVKSQQSENWSFRNEQSRNLMLSKRETLKQNILRDEYDLVKRELEILQFFTSGFGNSEEVLKSDLKEMAKGIKSRSILEIILLFARGDLGQLQAENNLTDAELLYGKRLIANYLTVAKRRDVEKFRLLPLLDKLANLDTAEFGSQKEKKLLQDIAAQLLATPQVDSEAEPAVSGFEFFNRLLVRDVQWEKIHELQEFFKLSLKGNTQKHLIQKLEMGFGKTFLIMPIYGFCAANGNKLSMSILPKELIEDMSKEINSILGNTFAQQLQRLEFDRNTQFSIKRLEDILQTISDVKKNRQFLMMTSQSVRSFYLKFIETWDLYSQEYHSTSPNTEDLKEYEQKIELMRQVLKLWEEADILFDEADLILNPKQRLSFAIGSQRGMPPERLAVVTELYRVLTSKSFNEKIDIELEFLRGENCKTKKNSYTPQYYHKTVKPVLAKMMLDRLSKRVQFIDEFTSFATEFPDLSLIMKKWSEDELQLVYQFLIDSDFEGKGYAFIKNIKNTSLIRILGLLKGELNQLLPLTLDRNYAERYGFHNAKDSLAGPYSGSNTPNKGSQFTDPWEIVNYSIQAHFKRNDYGLLINKVVSFAREQALKEMEIRGCDLDKTDAFINFQKNIGTRCRIRLFQENAVEKIIAHVKEDASFQLFLIESYILPEIKEFPEELSATSQVFSLIFNSTKGFTGTPWNWQTFPESTKVSSLADTDGATLVPLFEKSANKIFEVTSKGESRIVSLFNDNVSFKDANVFIDSGGILKGIPHEEIARTLRTIPWFAKNFDAVVYFDIEGKKMIVEEGAQGPISFENSNVPLKRRFTFIDQKHSTGTNIAQLTDAKGVQSVSKHMILRDFMQGAKRLRQLSKDQRLDIVIHEEDAPVLKEELGVSADSSLTFAEVIHYLWKRQLKLMGEENFISSRHKIQSKLQLPIFEQMKDLSKDPKSIANWFPKGRSLFFQTILDDPFVTYGEQTVLVPKDTSINLITDRILNQSLKSLFLEEPAFRSLKLLTPNQLKAWSRSSINLDHLDDQLNMAQGSLDQETEIEVETEQEVEQEKEIEQEIEIEQEVEEELEVDINRWPWRHEDLSIEQIFRELKGRKCLINNKYDSMGDRWGDMGLSLNQANPFHNPPHVNSPEPRIAKPVQYLLIHAQLENGEKKYHSMMIDINEANQVQKILNSGQIQEDTDKDRFTIDDPTKEGVILYALGVGQVSHMGLGIEGDPGKEDPKLLTLIVKAKLHDGEIFYNEDEQKVLKNLIKISGVEEIEKSVAYTLRDQPARRIAFPQSSLANIIKQIKEEK